MSHGALCVVSCRGGVAVRPLVAAVESRNNHRVRLSAMGRFEKPSD